MISEEAHASTIGANAAVMTIRTLARRVKNGASSHTATMVAAPIVSVRTLQASNGSIPAASSGTSIQEKRGLQ